MFFICPQGSASGLQAAAVIACIFFLSLILEQDFVNKSGAALLLDASWKNGPAARKQ